jgi:hypothetical protein
VCVGIAGSVCAAQEAAPDTTKQESEQLHKQQRELRKNLATVQKRLKLDEDAEIAALQEAYKQARKALEERITEKTRLDPEGARLLDEIAAVDAKLAELRKADKPARQPQGRRGGGDAAR